MDTLTRTRRRTAEGPDRTDREDRGRSRARFTRWLAAVTVGALVLYPVVALVLLPEGSGSLPSRLWASALIGVAVLGALAIARRAQRWIRGTALKVRGHGRKPPKGRTRGSQESWSGRVRGRVREVGHRMGVRSAIHRTSSARLRIPSLWRTFER